MTDTILQRSAKALEDPFPQPATLQHIIDGAAAIPGFEKHFAKAVRQSGFYNDREIAALSNPDLYRPSKIVQALEAFNEQLSDFYNVTKVAGHARTNAGKHVCLFDVMQEMEQTKAGRNALFDCSAYGISVGFVEQKSLGSSYADTLGGAYIRLPEHEANKTRLASVVIHEARHVRQANDPAFPSKQFRASPKEKADLQIQKEADALHQQELDRDERIEKRLPYDNDLTVGFATRLWMRVQKFFHRNAPAPASPLDDIGVVAITQSLNAPLNPRGASWRAPFKKADQNPFEKMDIYKKYEMLCLKQGYLNFSIDQGDLSKPGQRDIYYNRLESMEDLVSVCVPVDGAAKIRFHPDDPNTAKRAIQQTKSSLAQQIAADLRASYSKIHKINYQEKYQMRDNWNQILPDVMSQMPLVDLKGCMNSLIFPQNGQPSENALALAGQFSEAIVARIGSEKLPEGIAHAPRQLSDFLSENPDVIYSSHIENIAHRSAIILPSGNKTKTIEIPVVEDAQTSKPHLSPKPGTR